MTLLARRLRWAAEIALVIGVFVGSLYIFLDSKAKIDSDEGNWIGTTRYFETLFIEHDLSAEAWADGYWTRTQPMVFRYVIGSWLWVRGHDLDVLNPNYDYAKSIQANRRLGLAPPEDVLEDARTITRIMSALAVTALYLVVRVLAGPVGGIIGGLAAATMAAGSPYLEENLIRAKAESTLMFFLFMALFFAILSLRRAAPNWPSARWGILTGLFLGLAFGSKLTTILAIIAVTLWGAAAFLDDRFGPWTSRLPRWLPGATSPSPAHGGGGQREGAGLTPTRRGAPWVWPLAVLVTVTVVFIGSNPFLWRDPIGRSWLLFENRRDEMAQQQKDVPSRAVHELSHRAELVWDRSTWNDAFAPSRLGYPVEATLTAIGAVWLAVLAVRSARGGIGPHSVELLVFLWLALIWAGVSVGLGFLLQHYFVPTAMIAILLPGLVIGWSVQAVWNLVLSRSPQKSPAPPPRIGERIGA